MDNATTRALDRFVYDYKNSLPWQRGMRPVLTEHVVPVNAWMTAKGREREKPSKQRSSAF